MSPDGKNIDTQSFFDTICFIQERYKKVVFFIGGKDGLSQELIDMSHYRLAFGKMVWPYKLARVMLLEQLYRSACIKMKFPYHNH